MHPTLTCVHKRRILSLIVEMVGEGFPTFRLCELNEILKKDASASQQDYVCRANAMGATLGRANGGRNAAFNGATRSGRS